MVAFNIREDQVVGGPTWMDTQQFRVDAVADRPEGLDAMRVMLQAALVQDFALKCHAVSKLGKVMALVIAKDGPKIHALAASAQATSPHGQELTASSVAEFVTFLNGMFLRVGVIPHPIVDETGLNGEYDIHFRVGPQETGAGDGNGSFGLDMAEELVPSLRQQLGLDLKEKTELVDSLILDAVSLPSASN